MRNPARVGRLLDGRRGEIGSAQYFHALASLQSDCGGLMNLLRPAA